MKSKATMRLENFGIDRRTAELIVRAFAEGQYQLLAGAGLSYGAAGGDGVTLELAKKTSHQMASAFNFEFESFELDNLSFVYEEASARVGDQLRRFLLRRFVGCSPTWQAKVLDLHWRRIWTLNIDDVLENSFEISRHGARYGALSQISWRDQLRPASSESRELQIIHIHGIAERLKMDRDDIVFSPLEYSEVTQALKPWHAALQSSYVQEPFVICGATLTEEPDFVVATRISNQSVQATGVPSLVVTPGFTAAQTDKLKRFGLQPIPAFGEQFFDAVISDVAAYRAANASALSKYPPGIIERFLAQFRELTTRAATRSINSGSDFFSGDEPMWEDILANRDVQLLPTFLATKLLANKSLFVGLLKGSFASGKSAGLFRIAKSAIAKGFKVFNFRNESALDVSSAIAFLKLTPDAVLVFDDGADHSASMGKLLQACSAQNINCRLFTAERAYRTRGFRIDVADKFRFEFNYGFLTDRDISELVKVRRAAGRLGKYAQERDSVVCHLMRSQWRGELLECLSQIEFGEGFRTRIARFVQAEINAGADLPLIGAIACTHRLGFELPLTIGLSLAGGIAKLSQSLSKDGQADRLIIQDQLGLRLKHRIVSEYVWRNVLTSDQRYETLMRIATSLAPLINPATISDKSRPHRIIRELLDHESLSSDVGTLAIRVFSELESVYGWSSRFWDQRALFEYQLGNFPRAYPFAHKAVSLEKHAFAYTTLGTICLKEATAISEVDLVKAKTLFFEGVEALSKSRAAAEKNDMVFEHPYVAFFTHTAHFARSLPADDVDFKVIEEHWSGWTRLANDAACFQTEAGRKRLKDLAGIWLKVQLARGRDDASEKSRTNRKRRRRRAGVGQPDSPSRAGS